jgi:hypothetical protein
VDLYSSAGSDYAYYLQSGTNGGSGTVPVAVTLTEVTPEPRSLVLLATGAAGALGIARRKRSSALQQKPPVQPVIPA